MNFKPCQQTPGPIARRHWWTTCETNICAAVLVLVYAKKPGGPMALLNGAVKREINALC